MERKGRGETLEKTQGFEGDQEEARTPRVLFVYFSLEIFCILSWAHFMFLWII